MERRAAQQEPQACNPKSSIYEKTGAICSAESINDTLTLYRWLVGAASHTFSLASVSPSLSASLLGTEPFPSKIQYMGPDDPDYPNLIKITDDAAHIPGMRTVISTRLLANCKLTPSPDGTRVGNHKRSNLLDDSELCIKRGCTRAHTRCPEVLGQSAPCRYSASLRSARTRCFYQNLNLQVEVPLWEFSGSYDTSELLTECGGCVGTDGQVASEKRPLGRDRGKVWSGEAIWIL
ncbi:FRAS1-related extracellular matrix protein 2-like [Diceros bicornis minor]|uniref:FRAS1-related extracellular matrix protein 2-like n=1 Tax=Diceros bicornis minor TaxID=77932 RepID=UPI0026EEC76E|nr:FRAS1-related extracellular matrix protein 2-like [Diceros bicornis minor]